MTIGVEHVGFEVDKDLRWSTHGLVNEADDVLDDVFARLLDQSWSWTQVLVTCCVETRLGFSKPAQSTELVFYDFIASSLYQTATSTKLWPKQRQIPYPKVMPVLISKSQTPENVGPVMSSWLLRSKLPVFYTGTRYDHIARQFHTGHQRKAPWIAINCAKDLKDIIPVGCVPIAVDRIEGAKPSSDYKHPPRAFISSALKMDSEKEITDFCRETIYVLTNVAAWTLLLRSMLFVWPHGKGWQLRIIWKWLHYQS